LIRWWPAWKTWGLARGIGSFLVVLVSITVLLSIGWTVVERIDQFGADWPKYRKPLHEILSAAEMRLDRIESQAGSIGEDEKGRQVLVVTEPHPVRRAILSRLGSLSSALDRRHLRSVSRFFYARRKTPRLAFHHAAFRPTSTALK
jgi:hypothetical protein